MDIRNRIKEIVKHIWVNEVQNDYNNDMFLCEDTLKCTLLFHLRNYLRYEIKKENIRIYTEYCINSTKSRADIVIAYINKQTVDRLEQEIAEGDYYSVKQAVEPLAVFELKFLCCRNADRLFHGDYEKVMMKYSNCEELSECDFYLCFISEWILEQKSFVDKKAKNIIELTAIWNKEKDNLKWELQ